MKKVFLLLSTFLGIFTSCSKDDTAPTINNKSGETIEVYIDASYPDGKNTGPNATIWHYVSAKDGEIIGKGTNEEDATWAERKDWDLAIQRYKIRTNSGTSTSEDAKGGLYILLPEVTFADAGISHLGSVDLTVDVNSTEATMGGGSLTQSKSAAEVAIMEGMPPIWNKAPIYVIRSADGLKYYKVEFTQYKNDDDVSGHVKFNIAEIYK